MDIVIFINHKVRANQKKFNLATLLDDVPQQQNQELDAKEKLLLEAQDAGNTEILI